MLGSPKRVIALAAVFLLALTPVLALPVQTGLELDPSHQNSKSLALRDGQAGSPNARDLSPATTYATQDAHGTSSTSTSVSHRSIDPSHQQLETRQIAQVVGAVISGIEKLAHLISGLIAKAKAKRKKNNAEKHCIQEWVDAGKKEHPLWNWLVVHVGKTRANWKVGLKEGTDYSHVVHKCDLPGGSEADYDVFAGPHLEGDFYNDGGRKGQDVSYGGKVRAESKGKHLIFSSQ